MIQVTPHMRVLVAVAPPDFRCGIDGLVRICRVELGQNPLSGTLFAFRNRRRTAIKMLVYDGQGFWLCHKRLSAGTFRFWPDGDGKLTAVQAFELSVLMQAGNPWGAQAASPWRKVEPTALSDKS